MKRIIAYVLCVVIIFSFLVPCASASLVPVDGMSSVTTPNGSGSVAVTTDWANWICNMWDKIVALFAACIDDEKCPYSENTQHDFSLQLTSRDGVVGYFLCCQYCKRMADDIVEGASEAYLNSLDSTTVSSDIVISGFSADYVEDVNATHMGYYGYVLYYSLYEANPENTISLIREVFTSGTLYYSSKTLIFGVRYDYLLGLQIINGQYCLALYENPLGSVHSSLFGVYDRSDLVKVSDGVFYSSSYGGRIFTCIEAARSYYGDDFVTAAYSVCDPYSFKGLAYDTQVKLLFDGYYRKLATDSVELPYSSEDYYIYANNYIYFASEGTTVNKIMYRADPAGITWHSSHGIVGGSSDTPASSRPAALMQNFYEYNIDNSITDNSVNVNYYIGSVDSNNNITNVYNTNIYNEETMIFTEPVTGMQYQTTGWTYDYSKRYYDISLEAGSLTYDGTAVDQIVIQYNDDLLTIVFWAEGEYLGYDSYAYVAASGSSCSLVGHSYTYENVTEASCTTPGERKYTCSGCGNEYAEEIPIIEHVYEYSVFEAATCVASGIGLYTCSLCGTEYTEPIDPTGHVTKVLQYVPSEYDEEGTCTSVGYTVYECTVCHTTFTENDLIDVEDEGWFAWLGRMFRKLAEGLFGGLADGIEYLTGTVIESVTDTGLGLIEWVFGLFDTDMLDTWYNWFGDDNPYFEEEFGTEVDAWAQ